MLHMANKRLVVILLIFIFVAGIAISSVFVFRVQEITAEFMVKPRLLTFGKAEYEKGEIVKAELEKYESEAASIARGKNIVFGVDRDKITETIQGENPLVKVTNIEAKFPNRLEIRIRERIPMYYIEHNGKIAVLDYELQIIGDDIEVDAIQDEYIYGLISLNNQFPDLNADFAHFKLGDNLSLFTDSIVQVNTLVLMSRLLFNEKNLDGEKYTEYGLCQALQYIEFTGEQPDILTGNMVIGFTDPFDLNNYIRIELVDYKNDFTEKLRAAFVCLYTETDYKRGLIKSGDIIDGKISAKWLRGV
jgi:hypothetical protein